MTTACEMRCPWCCRNERAQRAYLVLSRVVCLAATRASCRRKRAGCGLSPPKTSAMSAMHGRRPPGGRPRTVAG